MYRIPRFALGFVALAAVMLVGCSSTTGSTEVHGASSSPATATSTAGAQPAAHGVEAAIENVPWSQVGPGWTLATWSPVPGGHPGGEPAPGEPNPRTTTTTLYLVDPAGGRYPITTFPPPGDGSSPALADWSGDGRRALFYMRGEDRGTVTEVDLHTGKQTTFTVDGDVRSANYSRPDGKAVLLTTWGDVKTPASMVRVDLAGNHQLTYPVNNLSVGYEPALPLHAGRHATRGGHKNRPHHDG